MDINLICTLVGILLAIFGPFSALILWMMARMENRIHADIISLAARTDDSHKRIDAMGARIDATQGVIMRILEKQGR